MQQSLRPYVLTDYTDYDASQLANATEANWSGLESVLNSSNWTTDPDISQSLSTLFSDQLTDRVLSWAAAPAGGRTRRRRPSLIGAPRSLAGSRGRWPALRSSGSPAR